MLRAAKYALRACTAFTRASPRLAFATANQVNRQVARASPKAPEDLAKVLGSELQFEKQRYTEFKEGEAFLKEVGYTLQDDLNSVEIKLMQAVGDKTIEIRYQANEPIKPEDDEEEESDEEKGKGAKEAKGGKDGEEEDKEGMKSATDFTVVVKNKDGSGLLFDCTTQETELNIFRVAYHKSIDELTKLGNLDKTAQPYLGPDFFNLDEKVQQSFNEYLEALGITDKLLAYIECTSIDKEQRMYLKWMGDIKTFVEETK